MSNPAHNEDGSAPVSRSQPKDTAARQFDEAEGFASSLRQQSTWVEESREAKVSVYERITLDDIDTDEMRDAAQFIETQAAEIATLKAQLEQAERAVDVLESNARVQAKLLADTGRRAEALEAALRAVDGHLDNFGYGKNMKARKIASAALNSGEPK